MRKRILLFLLIGIMLFTAAPTEAFATVSGDDASVERVLPVGGVQKIEVAEISEQAAKKIGIVNEEDINAGGKLQPYVSNYGSQRYASAWDVYSSNYIYNRLGAKERKLWNLLDAECRTLLDTTKNAERTDVNGKWWYVTKGVNFLTLGLTSQNVSNVFMMFSYSNPQYYFIDSAYVISEDKRFVFLKLYDRFGNGSTRKSETQKMRTQINQMTAQIEKGDTEVEKAQIAHDLIIKKVKYDHSYGSEKENTPYHQSAYSVFCDSYTVCAGYTKAFELLMNGVGIDTIGVTSSRVTIVNGKTQREGHAWNAACFNDSWYYIDCTWDDVDGVNGIEVVYDWFGLSEASITGSKDQRSAHKTESFYAGLLPACTQNMGSTLSSVGSAYVPVQTTEAPRITQKKTKNGIKVTLKSTTAGADIYYTTNGKNPSTSFGRSNHYTGVFTVKSDTTVKAIAVSNGRKNSAVVSADVKGRQYTVTFKAMGGSKVSSQKVWPGEAAAKPKNPKRKGYQFAGWYRDKSGSVKWKFSNKIEKNTTIYANWTKVNVNETAVKKLENTSGYRMEVTIQKVSGAKGYQIRYSANADMRSSKKILTTAGKMTISGLSADKVYYVQVRAYKLDSAGKKVYGNWSGSKQVTIQR